jgi:HPr kinase/phosphorylase
MTTVADLLQVSELSLSLAAGRGGLQRRLSTAELNRPSLELTGFFDAFMAERVQIFGAGEIIYLEKHQGRQVMLDSLARVVDDPVPCVIVSNGSTPPRCLLLQAEEANIPVLVSAHSTTRLYKRLWDHLDVEFAPETTIHGVLLDIHDTGVLLLGDSAVGKSECALELIRRGFRLVADDMVRVKCLGDSELVGRVTDMLPYHMEARGLGIIDIRHLYGVTAIRQSKRIDLAISLVDWDPKISYDRTGLDNETLKILDVTIPHISIPLRPGRNVGTLVEVATMNHILKSLGTNTAEHMQQKLLDELRQE